MSLIGLISRNILRHRVRTLLTVLGISIGIATIIMLGAVADGVKTTFADIMGTGSSDFIVAQANASDLVFSVVNQDYIETIANLPGVEEVSPALIGMVQTNNLPFFMVFGMDADSRLLSEGDIVSGRLLNPESREAMLGKIAAMNLGKEVGDTIELYGQSLRIAGIFETGSNMQDGGAVMGIEYLQRLTQREGKVTMISVWAESGADIKGLTRGIEDEFGADLVTITSVDEVSKVDQGADLIDAASWMMSTLAIVIGGIGVMNTMIISVYDRVREIGVLKALGWTRKSIIQMVLGEAVLMGLGAVLIGSLVGVGVLQLVMEFPAVRSLLQPEYSFSLWGRATVVAILVTLVGSVYPAWKAANLRPIEALRYE